MHSFPQNRIYSSDSGASPAGSLTPLAEAMYIPGYDILDELGHGGMATVYLARHLETNRLVALKIMAPGLGRDRNFTRRFLKEGQIIASLDDSRIVSVFESGVHEDNYFLCMEYLPGGTLKRKIHQGLTLEDSLLIIKTLAAGLEHAHERHLVHRDIKPQNILFRGSKEPVLSDFGIAKSLEGSTAITQSGQFLGSPQYMSPEQAKGLSVDTRSDIYSLGVVFFEMLTGRLPFVADDNIALAIKHITEPIPLLPLPLAHFQPVLDRLLAKHPNQRFQNMAQFLAMLGLAERRYAASFSNADARTTPLSATSGPSASTVVSAPPDISATVTAAHSTMAVPPATVIRHQAVEPVPQTADTTWQATTAITTVALGTVLGASALALIGRGLGELLYRQVALVHVELSNWISYGVLNYAAQGIFLVVMIATLLGSAFSHQRRSIWSVLRGGKRGGFQVSTAFTAALLDTLRGILLGSAVGICGSIATMLSGTAKISVQEGALLGVLASGILLSLWFAWRFGRWTGDLIGGQLRANLDE